MIDGEDILGDGVNVAARLEGICELGGVCLSSSAYEQVRRAEELNPNYATGRFTMAAALAELGRLDEARAEVLAGLALNPGFTIRRYRAGAQSDNPDFLKRRERIIEDMRKAGAPEG